MGNHALSFKGSFWRTKMTKVWNYFAGPCMLPVEVMKQAQEEFRDYNGTGMSVMDMSHRSKARWWSWSVRCYPTKPITRRWSC